MRSRDTPSGLPLLSSVLALAASAAGAAKESHAPIDPIVDSDGMTPLTKNENSDPAANEKRVLRAALRWNRDQQTGNQKDQRGREEAVIAECL